MPAPNGFYYPIASLTNTVSWVDLASSTFDFSGTKSDGSDIRVYDVTADANLPLWLYGYDQAALTGRVYFKASNVGNTHRLYAGDPAASAVSSFTDVFTHGTGFDSGWGDLSTAVAGTYGEATRLAGPASSSDIQNFRNWRFPETPCLQLSDMTSAGIPAGNYTGLREFGILRDAQNRVLKVGGKYYVFFTRRPSTTTDHHQVWRAESTSKTGGWGNFTLIYDPPSGIRLGYPGCAIKIGSTYYVYITYGWKDDGSGAATPGISIYYMTSTDLSTWSSITQCLTPGVFNDQTSGACTDIGNPKVIPLADGTYFMAVEGQGSGGKWGCYGATSSDGTTWTRVNSGNVLVGKGSAGTWDNNGAANPAPFQFPDGTIGILYNGADNATNFDWQLGWATASGTGGPFTKASFNPIAGKVYGSYGIETSAFCWDEDGTTPYHVVQWFASNSNTADFRVLGQEKYQGGLLLGRNAIGSSTSTDAALAGRLMDAGSWTAEVNSVMTSHRDNTATPVCLGIWNSASTPTPGANAGLLSIRVIEMFRWSKGTSVATGQGPGDITFSYWDSGGTRQFWNGSSWGTSTTGRNIAVNNDDEVVFQLKFDGTNYAMKAFKASDGSTIAAPTAVAASSVRSTSAGKYMIVGDPFTDAWQCGLYNRYAIVRPYTASDPTITLGSRVFPTVTFAAGSFALTGVAAGLLATRMLAMGTGSFVLSGQGATLIGPASRERDIRSDIRTLLLATDAFDNVYLTGTPEDHGQGWDDIRSCSIDAVKEEFVIDNELNGAIVVSGTINLTFIARDYDDQLADEAAERLFHLACNALNGQSLADMTFPVYTRLARSMWEARVPPERRKIGILEYRYLVNTWSSFGTQD